MLYAYNTTTGEYSMIMPFETELQEGTTHIAPPETKDNEVAVFDEENQKWNIFPDYRFTHQMIKENEIFPIENFGEIPSGYELITNEDAEIFIEQKRIEMLKMTPLDFIGVLQNFGLTLEEIDAYLNANLAIKTQLTYCQFVYCGVAKNLMPIKFEEIEITPEMVELAFRIKHGEIIE